MLEFIDRGYPETMLLVPGWAFDGRIFEPLDLPYNYLMADSAEIGSLETQVLQFIETHDQTALTMLGWSQGGIALSKLAGRFPEKVSQLILVSVRQQYPQAGLREIQGLLERSRATYLKCFYKACFAGADRTIETWFKATLLADYLETFTSTALMKGLDWLAQVRIDPEDLRRVSCVTFVHGADDTIAPIQEAESLAAQVPCLRL